ncbi:MAG: hypothetical protein Ta2E_10590 [Mycoplasmoidaceae bacterium]|nr:MAG: hypothetical protein Ta2E_10590 [Mycoplasmoidaceae bacterium]
MNNNITAQWPISNYVITHTEENKQIYIPNTRTDYDPDFNEYVLKTLKNLKSKIKTWTIFVGNSNNYTKYSVLSGKSEAIESGFGIMGIVGYKIGVKWLKYHNRYIFIALRDLRIHFDDRSVISGTTDDPENTDNSKIITSFSLKDIIIDINDIIKDIKNWTDNIKDIMDRLTEYDDKRDELYDKVDELDNKVSE